MRARGQQLWFTIPAQFRRALDLHAGDAVKIREQQGDVLVLRFYRNGQRIPNRRGLLYPIELGSVDPSSQG